MFEWDPSTIGRYRNIVKTSNNCTASGSNVFYQNLSFRVYYYLITCIQFTAEQLHGLEPPQVSPMVGCDHVCLLS